MKKFLLLLAFLLAGFITLAQPAVSWSTALITQAPGGPLARSHDMVVDASGNVYTTGNFIGVATFGATSLNLPISFYFYITKTDATGNLLWVKYINNNFNQGSAYAIALDASNNIYITGWSGAIDADPNPATTAILSGAGTFILKLDTNGNYVWAKRFDGGSVGVVNNPANKGYGIKVDAAGNVYTTGNFVGTVDFDPGSGVSNLVSNDAIHSNIYVAKLDASGNFVWAKAFLRTALAPPDEYSNNDRGLDLDVDAAGNVYTMGWFSFSVDFDPNAGVAALDTNAGIGSLDPRYMYISKLDTNGNYVWAKFVPNTLNDIDLFASMCTDATGNVYVTGSSGITQRIGYVAKYDTAGNVTWNKTFNTISGGDFSHGKSIAVDAAGSVYTGGNFFGGSITNPIDFDPGTSLYSLIATGASDGYISKLDAAGNFVWARRIGGTSTTFPGSDDYCHTIAIDTAGKVYYNGYAGSSFMLRQANADVVAGGFLASYTQSALANPQFELVKNISVYPNPTNSDLNINFENPIENATLKIISITGQIVIEKQNIAGDNFNYDVSNLSKGMYIVQITDGDSILNSKFIKE
jgi:Secretion system C-terminal sorting domain